VGEGGKRKISCLDLEETFLVIDVTITGSGRWNYLVRTVKTFNRMIHCSEGFRFHVTDDAGYNLEKDPSRKMIPKVGWFADWHFTDNQDYGECMAWLFSRVQSDIFIHLQDDWVFTKKMDFDPLIALMRQHKTINQIRLSKRKILSHLKKERTVRKSIPKKNVVIDSIPLVAAPKWACHPSLNRLSFVKSFRLPCGKAAYKPARWEHEWQANIFRGVDRFKPAEHMMKRGCYIYGQIGDPAAILHIGEQRAITHRYRK